MTITKLFQNLLIASLVVAVGGLVFTKSAAAQRFPKLIMQGSHGAFHIVEEEGSSWSKPSGETTLPKLTLNETTTLESQGTVPIVITRGPHGAGYLVTEPGMGGPEGSGVYHGFPKLILRGSHGAAHIISE
jgi:hypothetical protein